MAKQPTALIILDGFANRESEHGNAVNKRINQILTAITVNTNYTN